MDTMRFTVQQRSIIDDFDAFACNKIFNLSERSIPHKLDFISSHFNAIENGYFVKIVSNLILEIKQVKSTVDGIVKALKIKHETVYYFIMATRNVDSLMCDDLLYHIDLRLKQKTISTNIKLKANVLLALHKQAINVVGSKKDFHGLAISWIAKNWSAIMIENIAICSYLKNYIYDNCCNGSRIPKVAILSLAVHRSMIISIYCYIIEQCQCTSKVNDKYNYNDNSIDEIIDFISFYSMYSSVFL